MVVREGLGVPHGCLRGTERHSRWSGRGQEALLKVWKGWEALPEVQEGSGRLPGDPAGVGMPSGRSRRPWRPAWCSGRGQVVLPEIRKELGGPPGGPGGVGRPSRRSGKSREAQLKVQMG